MKNGPRKGGCLSVLHIVNIFSVHSRAQGILLVSFHDMSVVVCGSCGAGLGVIEVGGLMTEGWRG